MTAGPRSGDRSHNGSARADVAIAGAGIVGLAHAVETVRRGLSAVVVERDDRARGASVRNFGHGFVSAQAGDALVAALEARERWIELAREAGFWLLESALKTVPDLRGKSLALSEPGSTSGDALPRQAMIDAGIAEPKRDVKLEYAGGHPEALLALTKGKVDAAEINTQQLATAKKEGQFDEAEYRRLWESKPIAIDPITIRGDLDPAFKQKAKDALMNLRPADVQQVGAFLDVDPPGPMVAVTKQTYQPVFDLARKLGLTEEDV